MNECADASTPIRAIIADDHPLVLLAIENLLMAFPNIQIVGRASDSTELLAEAGRGACDLAVIDLHMPGNLDGDAFGTLREFRKCCPNVPLVVLTMETKPEVLERLISLGVEAVMSKRDRIDLIPVAIVTALAHERYVGPTVRASIVEATVARRLEFVRELLSPREMNVLRQYASGIGVTEIARRLGRSVKTVSAQKCKAMRKLALNSDSELFKFAAEHGLLPDDAPQWRP
ncbi:response regulator transcription factor [Paraburkholderia sp. BCC1885]|uniref:response regulator transcription factor n=1 Tax=Paraburkholderia sp. BCC1885 TaxID=2562669 RepID=UPI001182E897|nr:response regulator transcription factor [Paraburkholderia sp. BCC1885]